MSAVANLPKFNVNISYIQINLVLMTIQNSIEYIIKEFIKSIINSSLCKIGTREGFHLSEIRSILACQVTHGVSVADTKVDIMSVWVLKREG